MKKCPGNFGPKNRYVTCQLCGTTHRTAADTRWIVAGIILERADLLALVGR